MNSSSGAKRLSIDETACQLCGRCLAQKACKAMAIFRFDREEAPIIDSAACRECWACIAACPFEAVIRH